MPKVIIGLDSLYCGKLSCPDNALCPTHLTYFNTLQTFKFHVC